jgi:hypothetical protein
MRWLSAIVGLLLTMPVGVVVYFIRRTAQDPRQRQFAEAGVAALPDGRYDGTVPGYEGLARRWKGKRFDAASGTGLNLVEADGQIVERIPFRLYLAPRYQGEGGEVVRVDYNVPENPSWLRICADELVEVGPGEYLGVSYIRLLPGHPFAMLFFELRSQESNRPMAAPVSAGAATEEAPPAAGQPVAG